MKLDDANYSSPPRTEVSGTQLSERAASAGRPQETPANGAASGDDVHLSELVRSLRALAADSPERQARLEQIARAYAEGTYQVDPDATAPKIIDDALQYP